MTFLKVFIAISSLPLLAHAQQAGSIAQQGTTAEVSGVHQTNSTQADASGSAQPNGAAARTVAAGEMRPVNGELMGNLDSKSAKPGDPVVVKTTESTKTADGTVIPKGSKLVGHVTSVQAHGKTSADSKLDIQFDRAELKGGRSLPIHSEIRAVAPPASAAANAFEDDDAFGSPRTGGMVARGGGMGAARAGGTGGVLGGAGGLTGGGLASTTDHAASSLGSTTDETVRSSGQIAGNATAGAAGGRAFGAAGTASGATAHATGVRGVMLGSDASGKASGMFSASKQNVHLNSGTQMQMGISAAK
jgi:hypothetical protein